MSRHTRLAISSIAISALALLSGCSWLNFGDDDGIEPNELIEFEQQLRVDELWSRDVGEGDTELPLTLVPAVDSGRVFVAGREGRVVAMDTASGDVLWQVDTDFQFSGGPAADNGLVVVGGLNGKVLALDAGTGSEQWRAQVSSEVLAVPAIAGSRIVVRSIDGRVFAFDRADGSRVWVYDSDVPLLTLRGISDPLVRAGMVLVGLDGGSVIALNLDDGTVIWEQAVAVPEGRTELERLVDIDGNMVLIAADLYAASYQGNLAALALESGRISWQREISTPTGVTAMRNRLFVSDDSDNVWAFDRNGGASLWKNDALLYRQLTAPVPVGNVVVVGDLEGYLHVLSADSGEMLARVRIDDSSIDVRPRVENGVVYALSRDGVVAAYRFSEGG